MQHNIDRFPPCWAKSKLFGVAIGPLVVSVMVASGAAAAPASAPAPSAASAANLTPAQQANRDRVKGERETYRTQAQRDGVKGPEMRAAVQDCMAKVDPRAAKHMQCVQAGKAQNLSGDEMRTSVHQCMTSA